VYPLAQLFQYGLLLTKIRDINLGALNKFHPFDGLTFQKVVAQIGSIRIILFCEPAASIYDT
jgi:hypothetical protein